MTTSGNIEIKNINITYISTKTDNFDNTLCYFKVSGLKNKNLLSPILSEVCEECRIPVWLTEEGDYMVKVKQKYAPKILIVGTELKLTLIFKYYSMEKADKLLQGYYVMTKSED